MTKHAAARQITTTSMIWRSIRLSDVTIRSTPLISPLLVIGADTAMIRWPVAGSEPVHGEIFPVEIASVISEVLGLLPEVRPEEERNTLGSASTVRNCSSRLPFSSKSRT